MMDLKRRILLAVSVAAAACLCFGIFASAALAVPGDSIANAVDLTPSFGTTVTSQLVTDTATPYGSGVFYYRVQMTKFHTFNALFATDPWIQFPAAMVLPSGGISTFVTSTKLSSTQFRLKFTAPTSDWYNIMVTATTNLATFTVAPTDSAPVPYVMSGLTAPAKPKANKRFTCSVNMAPGYQHTTSPIRFYFDRKGSNGKFKAYGNWAAGIAGRYATYTRFAYSAKLPKGTYRMRARFVDGDHGATYTGYKSIVVK